MTTPSSAPFMSGLRNGPPSLANPVGRPSFPPSPSLVGSSSSSTTTTTTTGSASPLQNSQRLAGAGSTTISYAVGTSPNSSRASFVPFPSSSYLPPRNSSAHYSAAAATHTSPFQSPNGRAPKFPPDSFTPENLNVPPRSVSSFTRTTTQSGKDASVQHRRTDQPAHEDDEDFVPFASQEPALPSNNYLHPPPEAVPATAPVDENTQGKHSPVRRSNPLPAKADPQSKNQSNTSRQNHSTSVTSATRGEPLSSDQAECPITSYAPLESTEPMQVDPCTNVKPAPVELHTVSDPIILFLLVDMQMLMEYFFSRRWNNREDKMMNPAGCKLNNLWLIPTTKKGLTSSIIKITSFRLLPLALPLLRSREQPSLYVSDFLTQDAKVL